MALCRPRARQSDVQLHGRDQKVSARLFHVTLPHPEPARSLMLNLNWLIWDGAFLTSWATRLAQIVKKSRPKRPIWCRATKTAYLLRLTRTGRPWPCFLKIGKPSTCGFNFVFFGMVEGGQRNVVNRPISWRAVRFTVQGNRLRMIIWKLRWNSSCLGAKSR